MHRSGTSLITRAVNILEYSVGPSERLMPPAKDNPRGFWEARPVVDLNDHVLSELGGTWEAPPDLREGWDSQHPRLVDRSASVLGELFKGRERWVMKDPRLSFLLPLWERQHHFDRVLIAVRDPRAAASSVMNRNGLDDDWALYLWIRYMAAAMTNAPRGVVVSYEQMLEAPERSLRKLGSELGVFVEPATIEAFAENVDQELRHYAAPSSRAVSSLTRLADDIWSDLRGDDRPGLASVLPGIASGAFDVAGHPGVREMADLHMALGRVRTAAAPRARQAVRARELRVENRQIRLERERVRRDLRRLRQRRSVRAASAVASLASPGFRLVRRARARLDQ